MAWKNNPTLDEASSDYNKLLADLRGEIKAQVRSGRTWTDIATTAFVGVETVKRFAGEITKRPTSFTVNQLVKAVGFRLAIVPAHMPKLPGELG